MEIKVLKLDLNVPPGFDPAIIAPISADIERSVMAMTTAEICHRVLVGAARDGITPSENFQTITNIEELQALCRKAMWMQVERDLWAKHKVIQKVQEAMSKPGANPADVMSDFAEELEKAGLGMGLAGDQCACGKCGVSQMPANSKEHLH